jgi:very-short-patch-repair endonuclease
MRSILGGVSNQLADLGGVKNNIKQMPQTRKYKAKNVIFAKKMRKQMTKEEFKIWCKINNKQLGIRFHRQYPIDNFIVDFITFDAKIIIEIDGGQHCNSKYDKYRDSHLMKKGFRIFRFYNSQVNLNLDGVIESIFWGIKDKNYQCNYNYIDDGLI